MAAPSAMLGSSHHEAPAGVAIGSDSVSCLLQCTPPGCRAGIIAMSQSNAVMQ